MQLHAGISQIRTLKIGREDTTQAKTSFPVIFSAETSSSAIVQAEIDSRLIAEAENSSLVIAQAESSSPVAVIAETSFPIIAQAEISSPVVLSRSLLTDTPCPPRREGRLPKSRLPFQSGWYWSE